MIRRHYIARHLFLLPFTFVWVFPVVWMISSSLKTDLEFLTEPLKVIPDALIFANYVRAWQISNFSVYFRNSVIVTVWSVAIAVCFASLAGYALSRVSFRGKRTLIIILGAALFIPKGYIIVPLYQVIRGLGLLNTFTGLVVAMATTSTNVLFVLLFMAHFNGIPRELEESAELDGASFGRTFLNVMLPLAKPIIATSVVMRFMWTWNEFFIPLVLTLHRSELRTLTVGMYAFLGEYDTDWTGLSAAATISVIPVIILFIALQGFFIRGIAGAIKQ